MTKMPPMDTIKLSLRTSPCKVTGEPLQIFDHEPFMFGCLITLKVTRELVMNYKLSAAPYCLTWVETAHTSSLSRESINSYLQTSFKVVRHPNKNASCLQ